MRIANLFSLFKKSVQPAPAPLIHRAARSTVTTIQVVAPEVALEPGTPRYPPLDSGISVASPQSILATQGDLIKVLKRNLGLPEGDFERRYLKPLERAAELVNLLPATRDKHHTGAGGLFRFAATMAVRASQSAEGKIFAASEAIERRRATEDAWRHASFLTALTCELFRPMTEMIIVNEKGNQWSPFVGGLTSWAEQTGSSRFFVRWHKRDDHRSTANSLSSWAVNAVVGNELLSELHSIKPLVVETIFGVASGAITTADTNTLATLINEVRRRVIEKDNDVQPINYGKLTSGAHLEPYFLDAMRTLLRSGVWQVNTKAARCHYGADGFFIAWKSGSKEILGHLAKEKIAGVPTSMETLADMMGRAGIIKVAPDGSWVHMARSSVADNTFPAVLLQSPASVIGHLEVKPVPSNLRVNVSKTAEKQPTAPIATKQVEAAPLPTIEPLPQQTQIEQKGLLEIPAAEAGLKVQRNIDQDTGEILGIEQPPKVESKPSKQPSTSSAGPAVEAPRAPSPKTSKQAAPKGAIAAVAEDDEDETEPMDKQLLLDLGAPVCRELGFIRDRWNKGMDAGDFLRTPDGLAMSYSVLQSCAIPLPKITEALDKVGYLHTSVVSGKKRTLSPMPFGKKEELGIVLLTAHARRAGFILD